jgi:AraC-like DNA-binding protein
MNLTGDTGCMANPRLVRHRPHPGLAGLVAGIVGSQESSARAVERRQPAGSLLPLVISFGDPLEIIGLSDGEGEGWYSSFVAGFMPGHATTRFVGTQRCVQVYLTPPGAFRLLGLPGRELARRVTGLGEIAPFLGGSLPARLAETATWAARIGVVEQALLSVLDAGPEPDPVVTWLWKRIRESGGRARIDDLVAQAGWSHRHVTTRFRDQIGLPPKAAAGVVRFERATADAGDRSLAELAAEYGYADQSHLSREVVRYSGESPRAFLAARRPTAYTALGAGPS